ncbi:MAG: P-loop NTPase fold protein [Dehalococcoidia bacterium]|nr:P-loop NTPase fold protein [Dehalococcoidia bacterium]
MSILVPRSPKASSVDPWGDDLLNRKDLADNLTNLVRDLEDPSLSICIDGAWGTGKTFFLERWKYHLEKVGFPSPIYFNAWEDDFIENPLISILGQLDDHLQRRGIADREEILKGVRSAAFSISRGLIRKGSGIDITDMNTVDVYDTYLELSKARSTLIRNLSTLSADALTKTEEPKPIVFIIDELDRCRPTFAIELLERVKHIFNQVPGIIFVFGLNRTELTKSVQSVYGDIDADIYLRRFFDHRFTLPTPSIGVFSRNLFAKLRINELLEHNSGVMMELRGEAFEQAMIEIWRAFEISLRDIEQTASLINTVVRVMAKGQSRFIAAWEVGAVSTLRLKYPELYDGFISGKIHACDVVNKIEPLFANQSNGANTLTFLEAYLYVIESRDYERKRDSMNAFLGLYEGRKGFDVEQRKYFSNHLNEATKKGNDSDEWVNPRMLAALSRWLENIVYGFGFDRPQTIAGLIDLQNDPRAN